MCGRWTMSFRTTRLQKILSNIPYQFQTLPKYPQTHTMHPFAYNAARWLAYRIPHPHPPLRIPRPQSYLPELGSQHLWNVEAIFLHHEPAEHRVAEFLLKPSLSTQKPSQTPTSTLYMRLHATPPSGLGIALPVSRISSYAIFPSPPPPILHS